ncbi:S9 family peptidase [Desertivirga xinjiangensis]|uniref:S9 family peptidase n=1 Tax=Desertivirga xinjiangensis TaxID=539206 RepID=UPI002108C1C6|nr:S9 family peptidase [Pedobacter xinjiangensis]
MKKLFFLLFLCENLFAQTSKISIDSLFKATTFQQRTIYGLNSLKDGKSYASIVRDGKTGLLKVLRKSYADGKTLETIYSSANVITGKDTMELSTEFNEDESKVLLSKDEEAVYRRSTLAYYYVLDLSTKKLIPLSEKEKQLFPTFSPDGMKVAFVRNNNIFIKDLASLNELQVTADGKKNEIINGRSDWVYEEEFSFARAFFWSPDSKKIAYYKFDERAVPEFSMTVFNSLYPLQYVYKYPKAGEKNSIVSIHVYDTGNKSTHNVDVGSEKDQYIPRIKWTADPGQLCVLRLNRRQNKLDYLLADAFSGRSKVMLTEQDKYYIDIEQEQLTFLDNKTQFINTSERDGYNHIYLYNMDGKVLKQLTSGKWDVTELYGIDERNKVVYYQSAEASPLQRDIYSIKLSSGDKKRLSASNGTNSAVFSSDFSYYILQHSTINQPAYISLHNQAGERLRILEDNSALKNNLERYQVPKADFFTLKTSEGVDLNGYMIKPSDFDATKKYPVLLFVYGGPGSQNVSDSWAGISMTWMRMLAQNGYIVASVDNRGTGFRGAAFKKMTYKALGKYETIDQIEVAKWFGKQSFVDPVRIGIWGWSFGGYLSALCATKGNGIFKVAISVAPVTNWRFYDTIYTERFLQTPQENPEGYDDNSPINFADRLKGKFLLIHGTGDDNVHFQNSAAFSEALINANIPFEQAYYPNKNHSIRGGNTSIHLYSKLTSFIYNNL